jgi:hypothetical protein
VRPVAVVVPAVCVEHVFELAAVDDQKPVEAFAPERAHPPLDIRVCVRCADRRSDDLDVLTLEDGIEGTTEFAVAVMDEEAKMTRLGRQGS